MKCLNCNKRRALKREPYGYLYCLPCQTRQKVYNVKPAIELTTPEIKTERKKYRDDILQQRRGDTLSLEYIKKYGTKNIKATPQEIKEARNVWTENDYYVDTYERAKV